MESRNVKVSLETAKRWYEQGGEFKEMALSAFTETELNPVRNEWDSKFVGNHIKGYYLEGNSEIFDLDCVCGCCEKATFRTKKQAKSALAYAQLTQLMALPEYNGDWTTGWIDSKCKYVIRRSGNTLIGNTHIYYYSPIVFKSREIRDKFLENNYDLLKEYFELD